MSAAKVGDNFRFPLAEGVLRQPGSERSKSPRQRTPSPKSAGGDPRLAEEEDLEEEEWNELCPFSPEEEGSEAVPAEGDLQGPIQEVEAEPDFWSINDDVVIVHHRNSRSQLYVPDEATFPIPLRYIDVVRRTTTDIDSADEHEIQDFWTKDGARELTGQWFGKTVFKILRPPAPFGWDWVEGRLTKIQKTTRPGHLLSLIHI